MHTEELSGSCLCGAVRYRAAGEPVRFYHCHCSRCRKATGTGHASNLFLKGSLTVLAGADMIGSYKVPEAERFTTVFCRTCGSRLPRFVEKVGIVLIPAGSLDTEPSITPQARIFVDSRAGWSCNAAALPEFSGSPA